jgi:hypothetical protein
METKEYISKNIIRDIEELADDVSVLFDNEEDGGGTPKVQIDEMIVFAKKNGIDFWAIVKSNCSPYEKERLEYIYEGKDLEELDKRTFKQ